jgi:hypothetical protein
MRRHINAVAGAMASAQQGPDQLSSAMQVRSGREEPSQSGSAEPISAPALLCKA